MMNEGIYYLPMLLTNPELFRILACCKRAKRHNRWEWVTYCARRPKTGDRGCLPFWYYPLLPERNLEYCASVSELRRYGNKVARYLGSIVIFVASGSAVGSLEM